MTTPAKSNQDFLASLDRLNPEQRQAVEHLEGPLLVLAGPGTGKTQMLTTRIAYLVGVAGVEPQNILCLTFTNTGARQMRNRLARWMGNQASQVRIQTYNAFGQAVTQDETERLHPHWLAYLQHLGVDPAKLPATVTHAAASNGLALADDLDRRRTLLDVLRQHIGPGNPLFFHQAGLPDLVGPILSLFDTMKRQGLGADALSQAIDAYIKELPQDEAFQYKRKSGKNQKGDPKQHEIDKVANEMRRTQAAAALLAAYNQALAMQGLQEYADQIGLVNFAFGRDEDLKADYQERYQYLMLDEYQDTNDAQNQLIYHLTLNDLPDEPNVMAVGDDDQAVFGFQGANPASISDFLRVYPGCKVIPLVRNYRSTAPILRAATHILATNTDRLINEPLLINRAPNISKDLVAEGKGEEGPLPQVRTFPDSVSQSAWLAKQLLEQHSRWQALQDAAQLDEEARRRHPDNPANTAILFSKHRQAEDLLAVLRRQGVPTQLKRSVDLLDQGFVRQLVLTLRWLVDLGQLRTNAQRRDAGQGGNATLFQILHFPLWGVPAHLVHLASLRYHAWAQAIDRNQWPGQDLLTYLLQPPNPAQADDLKPLHQLATALQTAAGLALTHRPAQVLDHLMHHTQALVWVHQQPNRLELLQLLQAFYNHLGGTPRLADQLLADVVATWDLHQRFGLPLAAQVEFGYAGGFQFATAHGAKGEEYHRVYLLDATAKTWDQQGGKNSGLKLPPPFQPAKDEAKANTTNERNRLLYVVATRAEHELHLLAPEAEAEGGSEMELASRVQAMLDEGLATTPSQGSAVTKAEVEAFLADRHLQLEDPEDLMPLDMMPGLLADYQLSASALNTYLSCPRQFYFGQVLRAPQPPSSYLAFGNAIHAALEVAAANRQEPELAVEEALNTFERFMAGQAHAFSTDERPRKLEEGRRVLATYLPQQWPAWQHLLGLETELKLAATLAGVPCKGVIDRLDERLANRTLVDYKTGKATLANRKKLNPPKPEDEDPAARRGGDYWRQLIFYHLLLKHQAETPRPVDHAMLVFLGQENSTMDAPSFYEAEVDLTPEAEDTVLAQVKEAWQGIQAMAFDKLTPAQRDAKHSPCPNCDHKAICWGDAAPSSSY